MKILGKSYRTIWVAGDGYTVEIIDQTKLPHSFCVAQLNNLNDTCHAIASMQVRGAPLIGITGVYGLALAMREDSSDEMLHQAHARLLATRPTAVNLQWALDEVKELLAPLLPEARVETAYRAAARLCDEDIALNSAIGDHGLKLIKEIRQNKGEQGVVNILTHCNAGWLATVDWGTALAPIYKAHNAGIPLHVWVDETRPRNQGASLTAFELLNNGVAHEVIADNVGGHLMQHGLVDLCIVGTDRTTATGDVCNKIGTYLKALAAVDNQVPFYVALPSPTIDWQLTDGLAQIPIEQRDVREVTHITGLDSSGQLREVQLTPRGCSAVNYGFDVTPARLVSGLITERGVCQASAEGLAQLFPEYQEKNR